ncbi:hypothetical protein CP968_01210 [Streptomyces subrutilus]|uniref:Uncharacterized protein n=1 Tax=Streptomyces subrutilus TaxID=36818 RepID=A0A5P2UKH9_9ACTN|nr:hypothetical protein CP968_01210 [Streptomyces subrutilus]
MEVARAVRVIACTASRIGACVRQAFSMRARLRLPAIDHAVEARHRLRLVVAASDLGYATQAAPPSTRQLCCCPSGRAALGPGRSPVFRSPAALSRAAGFGPARAGPAARGAARRPPGLSAACGVAARPPDRVPVGRRCLCCSRVSRRCPSGSGGAVVGPVCSGRAAFARPAAAAPSPCHQALVRRGPQCAGR